VRQPPVEADRSIPELLQKLASETSILVRQEVELARAEFICLAQAARRPAVAFGVAGAFGIGTIGAMTALLIAAITIAVPLWASALIVTAVYVLITGVAVAAGRSAMHDMSIVPQQTIKTITDDVRTVRSGIERAR
jgi:hypothetical protein